MKKIIPIFFVLLIIFGGGVIVSPIVSNTFYKSSMDKGYQVFDNKVKLSEAKPQEIINKEIDKLEKKDGRRLNKKERFDLLHNYIMTHNLIDVDGLYNLMKERNEKYLKDGNFNLTGSGADDIDLGYYGIKDGIVGYINIPAMNDIRLPIYLGASGYNLTRGACHITGTTYPIGGIGNTVIVAHRNYTWFKMFNDIDKLKAGDKVYIRNFKNELVYKVVSKKIIDFSNPDPAFIHSSKDILTLCSCQFNDNQKLYDRYIVVCERVL